MRSHHRPSVAVQITMRSFFRTVGLVAALSSVSFAAKLTQVTSGWENPTKLGFYIYVPDKLAAKPPVILVVCLHISVNVVHNLLTCEPASSMWRERPGHLRTGGERAGAASR